MLLRKDDPWPKDLPVPDIRDWRVLDAEGRTVGFVQSLAIDRNDMRFEALLTGASDRYAADDVEVGDGVVRINRTLERRRPSDEAEKAGRHTGFEEAFGDHFRRTFESRGLDFDDVRPAYQFGRIMALDADYSRRSFVRAEEDLRAEYVARRLHPPFAAAREAVRFGYQLAQNLDRYRDAGMDREEKQIVGEGEPSTSGSARTGSAMDTGSPPEADRSVLGGG